ncbi:MAG: FkbM family methyltransferase [Ruminiclostridium sp.]|nr:FkbM family methyltransferase [Ruminiclostridium sp.]
MLTQVHELLSARNENMYNDYISSLKGRNIALYGAGGIGYATGNILKDKGLNVCCFIDDDQAKQGTYIDGINVVSLKDIQHDAGYIILICTPSPACIYEKLASQGYHDIQYFPVLMAEKDYYNTSLIQKHKDKINKTYNLLADDLSRLSFCNILKHRITMDFSYFDAIVSRNQYFPSEIFSLTGQECLVDGGAYHGETIVEFINATGNSFKYIYAFEPDRQNFNHLMENTGYIAEDRLKLMNAGLYSETGKIGFSSLGNSGSFVSEAGNDVISMVRLDEAIGEHKPTYIKLDIEGAEEAALGGMKNTIAAYRPKLAISIYHKSDDLWELPLVIHSLNPFYDIYIRHYSKGLYETVCYAV